MIQKIGHYRNKKLTQTARGQECTILFPLNGLRHDPDTVVWAHSNQSKHGKGERIKAHDCFGAFACMHCHNLLDQNKRYSREEKNKAFDLGMQRTRRILLREHIIIFTVNPVGFENIETSDATWLFAWKNEYLRVAK